MKILGMDWILIVYEQLLYSFHWFAGNSQNSPLWKVQWLCTFNRFVNWEWKEEGLSKLSEVTQLTVWFPIFQMKVSGPFEPSVKPQLCHQPKAPKNEPWCTLLTLISWTFIPARLWGKVEASSPSQLPLPGSGPASFLWLPLGCSPPTLAFPVLE